MDSTLLYIGIQRIASEHPETRRHLLPLLAKYAATKGKGVEVDATILKPSMDFPQRINISLGFLSPSWWDTAQWDAFLGHNNYLAGTTPVVDKLQRAGIQAMEKHVSKVLPLVEASLNRLGLESERGFSDARPHPFGNDRIWAEVRATYPMPEAKDLGQVLAAAERVLLAQGWPIHPSTGRLAAVMKHSYLTDDQFEQKYGVRPGSLWKDSHGVWIVDHTDTKIPGMVNIWLEHRGRGHSITISVAELRKHYSPMK